MGPLRLLKFRMLRNDFHHSINSIHLAIVLHSFPRFIPSTWASTSMHGSGTKENLCHSYEYLRDPVRKTMVGDSDNIKNTRYFEAGVFYSFHSLNRCVNPKYIENDIHLPRDEKVRLISRASYYSANSFTFLLQCKANFYLREDICAKLLFHFKCTASFPQIKIKTFWRVQGRTKEPDLGTLYSGGVTVKHATYIGIDKL